jgi:hypothetical protein
MRIFSKRIGWTWILITLITGCNYEPVPYFPPNFPVGTIEGYRPVYASASESDIVFVEARQLENPGKIYVVSKYLLINEKFKGIHVFDNSDPTNPVPLGFLKMLGNSEFAVKNNVLYADHLSNLVALDISDWNNLQELSRTEHQFWSQKIPPGSDKYFECIDLAKGIVIGWELAVLDNPKCFR